MKEECREVTLLSLNCLPALRFVQDDNEDDASSITHLPYEMALVNNKHLVRFPHRQRVYLVTATIVAGRCSVTLWPTWVQFEWSRRVHVLDTDPSNCSSTGTLDYTLL